jgi:hypothetical protein
VNGLKRLLISEIPKMIPDTGLPLAEPRRLTMLPMMSTATTESQPIFARVLFIGAPAVIVLIVERHRRSGRLGERGKRKEPSLALPRFNSVFCCSP